MSRPTHYDVLGVPPSADATQIREAYRTLARRHHPDRAASGAASSTSLTMPQINEAYRVLNDPARRVVYDAGLRGARPASTTGPAAAPSESAAARPPTERFASHLGPARVPWRSLLFFGSIAVVGVVVLAQFTDPGTPRGPDGLLEVGSCVSIDPNGDAREVACTSDASVDLVIMGLVPFDAKCPTGSVAHRDRQGMGVACVADPGEIDG